MEYQPIDGVEWRLVCHQAQLSDFAGDEDVRQALALADGPEKESYQEECLRITALQKQVAAHAAVTEPYDVIVIADEGSPAALERAGAVCAAVTAAGLRCLCPALELARTPRQDWEPVLHHAVNTAGAMVYAAVGKEGFPPSPRFDAERYLSRKAASQRAAAAAVQMLVVAYDGLDEYEDIPDSLFDGADLRLSMADPAFLDQLCAALTAHKRDYGSALHVENAGHDNYEYTNLIRQARLALDGGDFEEAEEAYNQILNFNAGESQAYWGLVLAKHRCKNEDALIQKGALLHEEGNYRSAVAFANEREAQTYRNVAQAAREMYEVHARQAAEEERRRREQEALRARKEREVQEDLERQTKKRAKARGRRTVIILVLLIALIVGGIKGYQAIKANNELEKKYQEAMDAYNGGRFSVADDLFRKLGDYKDSAEMCEISQANAIQEMFYNARFNGEDLNTRAAAIDTMLYLLEEENMTECQEYLDTWLQEGKDLLAQGENKKAYLALKGFGSGYRAYIDMWRVCLSQGLVSIADNGTFMAIAADNGALRSYKCEHFDLEEGGSYTSVSVSDSGNSAALVRADGTAYVVGDVAEKADVSQWTDLRCIQTTDSVVVALKKDGTLLSSKHGTLTTGVTQFDLTDGEVAAVRSDGTVFTTVKEAQKDLSEVANAAYIAIDCDKILDDRLNPIPRYRWLIVSGGTGLTGYGYATEGEWFEWDDFPAGGVVAAFADAGCVGVLTTGGEVYSTGWDIPGKAAYSKTFLVDFSQLMDLRVMSSGEGNGMNGMEEDEIAVRKAINALEGVGLFQ